MKKFIYIVVGVLLSAAVTSGCTDLEEFDKELVNQLDETKPALVVFTQSLNSLLNSTGAVNAALNLNEYLNSTGEDKELVEDYYYTYKKIRHSDEIWHIYDAKWSEKYRLHNSLTLSDKGAIWDIISSPSFFGYDEQDGHIQIERTNEGVFRMKLTEANIPIYSEWDNPGRTCNATINADLTIRLSDEPSSVENSRTFLVSGSGHFVDPNHDLYSVKFTTNDPIEIQLNDYDGSLNKPCYGSMKIEFHPGNESTEYVDVVMSPYYAILLKYTSMGKTYTGYYNWRQDNITPR